MSNPTDTNQASEDELDTFMEQLGFLWDSYQSNWRNDGREQFDRDYDDSISMDLAKQLLAHLRTEKLKLLAEVRERVVGEVVTETWYNKYLIEPGNEYERKFLIEEAPVRYQNKLKKEQLTKLTKLEAEL